jgi:hypothetical protein
MIQVTVSSPLSGISNVRAQKLESAETSNQAHGIGIASSDGSTWSVVKVGVWKRLCLDVNCVLIRLAAQAA